MSTSNLPPPFRIDPVAQSGGTAHPNKDQLPQQAAGDQFPCTDHHGIEPKGSTGTILIHVGTEQLASKPEPGIRIDVTDDGVGMSPEKAKQILQSNSDNGADFFREIGVSNVHKRLQYEFGEEYGITIESVEGQFTTMSIHIPNRCQPQNDK